MRAASTLLLRATDLVRGLFNGRHDDAATYSYGLWAQTGDATATQTTTTSSPQLTTTTLATTTLTFATLNEAPVMATASPTLTGTNENTTSLATAVSTILGTTVSDADVGAVQGIAITSVGNLAGGSWEYSTSGGASWSSVGAVSATSALLLRATDLVRYVPNGQNGETATLAYKAWDQTSGTYGTKDTTELSGGTTAFSLQENTASLAVAAVNDAPVMVAASPLLTGTNENTISARFAVSGMLGTSVSDVDTGAVQGIAITGVANLSGGAWQYSTNGGTTWLSVGAVSSTSALLLRATDLLRYSPNGKNGETATLTYKAWDQTSGTYGTKVTTATSGDASAFSLQSNKASMVVTSVNDAPVMATASPTLTGTDENTTSARTTISTMLGTSVTDVDTGAVKGIAITGVSNNAGGAWQYSTNGGTTWTSVGTVSSTSALLLRGTDLVHYVPNDLTGETAKFTYKAWDQTIGSVGTKVTTATSGGTTAFSTRANTASLAVAAVNDAPVLNAAASPAMHDQLQDAAAPSGSIGAAGGTLVSSLIMFGAPLANVKDVDGTSALTGMAVTALDGTHGTWWYTLDDGATPWTQIAASGLSNTNALLLGANANTGIYFQPNSGFTGTIASAITFRAWDQTSGAAGGFASTATNGGTSAFSSATDTAALAVTAPSSIATIDLETIAPAATVKGYIISAGLSYAHAGGGVSGAGDVNGDGLGDFLLGETGVAAQAFLLFGAGSQANLNLQSGLTGTVGVKMFTTGGQVGGALTGGADFNGDGYSDFSVGAPAANGSIGYGFLGMGNTSASLNTLYTSTPNANELLAKLDGSTTGTEFTGSTNGDNVGRVVKSIGDFNNDGYGDYAFGTPLANSNGQTDSGAVTVVFGKPNGSFPALLTQLSSVTASSAGFNIKGTSASQNIGTSLAAGDFNGDGIQDLVIGAPTGSGGNVYIVFGTSSAPAITAFNSLNIATGLNGTNGVRITTSFGNQFGSSVSSVGDVNGDGIDDLLIGQMDPAGFQSAYVIFGTRTPSSLNGLDVITQFFTPTNNDHLGFAILSHDSNAPGQFALSVSGAGDVNGDGFADLLIGAPQFAANGLASSGESYVIFGRPETLNASVSALAGFTSVSAGTAYGALYDLNVLTPGQQYVVFQGHTAGDVAGTSVAGVGDANGDGFADFIIGAANASSGAGKAYLVDGGDYRLENTQAGQAGSTFTAATTGDALVGTGKDDTMYGGGGSDVLLGAGGNDVIKGGAGNDRLIGGLGNDTLDGQTGNDVLIGGGGNDILYMGAGDTRVDGGLGTDTVRLDPSHVTLDLTLAANRQIIKNVEAIDLGTSAVDPVTGAAGGTNTLRIDVRDILDMTSSSHHLTITGDASDHVDFVSSSLGSWTKTAGVSGAPDQYTSAGIPNLLVLVDHAVTQTLV